MRDGEEGEGGDIQIPMWLQCGRARLAMVASDKGRLLTSVRYKQPS